MSVVAKFFVQTVETHDGSPTADRVVLGAVCRGRENRQWASATPSGHIQLAILNDRATAYFEQGQEYLVTFEKAARPTPGDGHAPVPAPQSPDNGTPMCEFCGTCAAVTDDGAIDWARHYEIFGDPR